MPPYQEEILESWKAGRFFEAISYFFESMAEGLFNQEKTESFNKNLLIFWKLVEGECEENPEVVFALYEMVKKARNWDDKTLCKKLRINEKDIQDIKNRHKLSSEGVWGLGCSMSFSPRWLCKQENEVVQGSENFSRQEASV